MCFPVNFEKFLRIPASENKGHLWVSNYLLWAVMGLRLPLAGAAVLRWLAGYLGLALVFVWDGARWRGGFGICFSRVFY